MGELGLNPRCSRTLTSSCSGSCSSGLLSGFIWELAAVGGSTLGPVLVGVFGILAGLHAFLPCDLGCEFRTFTETMHNLTGLGGFIAAIAGIFVVSRRLKEDSSWRALYRFSLIAGVAAAASLVLWIGVAKDAEVGNLNGVLQRSFVAAWLIWMEVMAIRLFQVSRRAKAGEPIEGRLES